MQTGISVIVPAFNASRTLTETLDSIQAQTRPPDEVIVINDGSTDNTHEIAITHSIRPEVINSERRGAAATINEGIKKSNCGLLAFIDADDLWECNKLELQENRINNSPDVAIVLTYMKPFICSSVPDSVAEKLVFKPGPQPGYLLGTLLCRRNVFDNPGILDNSLATGYFIEWFDRVKTAEIPFDMLQEVLMYRRIRPGTLSQRTGSQNGLSDDFIEIARRAIMRKRNASHDAT